MRGRVRWGNVGRAVAAVAVVALVVAWPRLDGGRLEVPGGAAVPVAPTPARAPGMRREAAPPPAAPEPGERARRHGRSVTEHELRAAGAPPAPRPKARRERRRRRAAPRSGAPAPAATPRAIAPAPPPAVAPDPNPAPPPAATVDPAEREFGFER